MSVRPGTRLAVDVGSVRIGVARSDPEGLLATPVRTVASGDGDIAALVQLADEVDAVEVLVGLPRSLSGAEGPAAQTARAFAARLAAVTSIPVRLVDERLSTAVATQGMRASGVSSRKARSTVDQAAAVVILQDALDLERGSGAPPGEMVEGNS
ncbi:MAG TPA: Holliday junction resolvase RuvX [Jiangellaceae bacterium]|nr:Holliday junction resolvase RuvX [Jiangellaceae bacterium]